MSASKETKTLAAALLWLRNHYDVGNKDVKRIVLARIDRVLEAYPVSVVSMRKFRKEFPVKAHIESAGEQ